MKIQYSIMLKEVIFALDKVTGLRVLCESIVKKGKV